MDDRLAATLAEAQLLGVAAHGAPTPIGRAVLNLLHGAARYYPAIPGSGPSPDGHPRLAGAVTVLRHELHALLPDPHRPIPGGLTTVATGAPSAELTDLLASCADRESEGHTAVWRISAASVHRALDAGHDPDELLANLREGGHDLPQPLAYLINDTARTHGRMRVVRFACCIRSDDESLVLELSKTRSLAKIGLRRIAPTVLISTADPDTTLIALRNAGYAPVLEAEPGTTVIQRPERDRAKAEPPRPASPMPSAAPAATASGAGPRGGAAPLRTLTHSWPDSKLSTSPLTWLGKTR